jgi:hypothetical protein
MTQSFAACLLGDERRQVGTDLLDRLACSPSSDEPIYILASATYPPGVGSRIHTPAGNFAAIVQGMVDKDFAKNASTSLGAGDHATITPSQIIEQFRTFYDTEEHAERQIAFLTPNGAQTYSGPQCIPFADDYKVANAVAIANMMTSTTLARQRERARSQDATGARAAARHHTR